MLNNFGLFPDGLGPSVNFLEHDLHEGGLEFGQHLHLADGFVRFLMELIGEHGVATTLALEARTFNPADNALGILIFLLLNVFLNELWVKAL